MSPTIRFAVALVLASSTAVSASYACDEGMVRDAAFSEQRDVYRLCVIARADDPARDEIVERLKLWLKTSAAGLNMEIVSVAADAPDVAWTDLGIPSAPPELPVVVLVGRRNNDSTSFVVDHWQPAPTDQDLDVLRTSPARDAIRREIVEDLAVVVFVPGTDGGDQNTQAPTPNPSPEDGGGGLGVIAPDGGGGFGVIAADGGGGIGKGTEDLIERVRREWSEKRGLDVAVVRVDRTDARERLLLSFTNTTHDGPDWVGFAFGKGKFMTPLEGDEISDAELNRLLETLAADCTCSQSPSRLGVDLLMEWDAAVDDQVVLLDSGKKSADEPSIAAAKAIPRSGELTDPTMSHIMAITLWSFGGLAVISIVATGAVLWRSQRASRLSRQR